MHEPDDKRPELLSEPFGPVSRFAGGGHPKMNESDCKAVAMHCHHGTPVTLPACQARERMGVVEVTFRTRKT
jgi:hypothetical protein